MNAYELSWSDQFCREDLLTKIDELALEVDILKIDLKHSRERAEMMERLYHNLRKTFELSEVIV